ncbi:MAG: NADAR family protein [Polyangiaceae bacterium]|nr:NADAR family protein [Polyangiaceae bacterium]
MTTTTEPYDLESLRQQTHDGWEPTYLFFWGHTAKRPGVVGKECLSQWYPASFVVDGTTYSSAEHFMMAKKALLFGDEDAAGRIVLAKSPAEAKELGRGVRDFDEARWEKHRFDFVVEGNYAKFGQNRALSDFLRSTKDKVLVEASPTDRIWGIGLNESDDAAHFPDRWRGLNLLGFALMRARATLSSESR